MGSGLRWSDGSDLFGPSLDAVAQPVALRQPVDSKSDPASDQAAARLPHPAPSRR